MPEITKADDQGQKPNTKYLWIGFAVLVVFVYFFGLSIPLVGPDEPRYAQVAREMFERNDWITPTLGGFNWFEKPALLYWLQIASFKIFGVSEFAARCGSALCGLGTIFSLWIFGKYCILSTNNEPTTNNFSNWLALIAASTIGIIVFSRGDSFDIVLTFPITAAMVSFFIFDRSSERNYLALASFYLFIGVALLAKGLVGIVFPYTIVAFYLLLSRKWPSKQLVFSLVWGTVLASAVAATWYVPMYLRHGWTFVDEFFIQHHFQRFTSNKYQHPQPFYFFFWVLPLMTIPWLPFLLIGIWNVVKGQMLRLKGSGTVETVSPLLLFSISWLFVPLVFFSFSGSKLPGYILPALPAAIIICAERVYTYVQTTRRFAAAAVVTAVATLVITVGLLMFVVPGFAEGDSVKKLMVVADERGYGNKPVFGLHTISHNAEFYAAGRLVRDQNGKQIRFPGPSEINAELKHRSQDTGLIIVPIEYSYQIDQFPALISERLADNGELAIYVVRVK